jgi:hypothetical protein
MRFAPCLLVNALWLVGGRIATGGAVAAGNGAASDAAKRPNNSFNLFVPPPPGASAAVLQAPGVGFASSKGVITDPYKVPLIQNAGSLTPGR